MDLGTKKITLPLTFQLEVSSLRAVSLSRRSDSAGQVHGVYGGYRSERGTFSEDWRCCLQKRRHMTNKRPTHYSDSTEINLFPKLTQSRHTSLPFKRWN